MASAQYCPISKLEKVLLATDGSQYSEGAVREAINFAKICSSRLFAIMVLETNPEYETIGSNVFEKEEAEARKHLESVKERAVREGVDCETIFHSDRNADLAIVEEAGERAIDMIVIGRRGRTGLAKLLLGAVGAKVIGGAPCKVLVVPRAARIEYRTILAAVDGSPHSEAALREAIAIAKKSGSRLIVLSAMRDESERAEAEGHVRHAVELAKKEGLQAEAVTPLGRSHNAIVETAGGRGVDLIVMGTYGKTGLKKALLGSSTEKVIGHAGCAVLVAQA
jgi:nucleotide-binding universal stress UspA family protein